MQLLDELDRRGLLQDVTDRDALGDLLRNTSVPFYVGFDPTSSSLHLGSMVPIAVMARLQRAGHKPLVLVGGATGMVGDPSGKSAERQFLDAETLQRNLEGIRGQLSRFLSFDDGPNAAAIVNNADWFAPVGYLQFLRDVGKHLTVNYMMAKESVRARLQDRDQGISYTEFSYMLLQAYDFVHLAQTHGCRLQAGASDQWGNITAGIELQRKLGGPPLYGLTCPLLMDAAGNKMGKTAGGATLWLDPERTSPYAFYQYLINVPDADVPRLLKMFSWRSLHEIDQIAESHAAEAHRREGQRTLARELCQWVHGKDATRRAEVASRVMFGGSLDQATDADLMPLMADLPSSQIPRSELQQGILLCDMLARTGLAPSKGGARRLVSGGGVYVNNQRASDSQLQLNTESLGTESLMILRVGKKQYHIVKASS